MKLYISGGGSGEQSAELDRKFADVVDKSKPVLYIPIAIDKREHSYEDCLEWITNNFKPFNLTNFELWTEEDLRKHSDKDLERFGGVYISGGNTFYLMKELRESGFLSKLKKLIQDNIPIYGGSAGGIIHAKTIILALSADLNEVNLKDFSGMNNVKDYDLWFHYEERMHEEVERYKRKYKMKIIALPEDCGLYVTRDFISVVGPGSASLFDEDVTKFEPGKIIKITKDL